MLRNRAQSLPSPPVTKERAVFIAKYSNALCFREAWTLQHVALWTWLEAKVGHVRYLRSADTIDLHFGQYANDVGSSGPAGHTAAIYAARADLKREFPRSLAVMRERCLTTTSCHV